MQVAENWETVDILEKEITPASGKETLVGRITTVDGDSGMINGYVSSTTVLRRCYGSFPPTETDSDSKPYCYIVLCTTFSTGMDSDSDPCMDSFPNGCCTHFRDGSPSQGSESESVAVGGNESLLEQQ